MKSLLVKMSKRALKTLKTADLIQKVTEKTDKTVKWRIESRKADWKPMLYSGFNDYLSANYGLATAISQRLSMR